MNVAQRIQADVIAHLSASEACTYVPVIGIDATSDQQVTKILQIVNKALAGTAKKNAKAGVAILVPLPAWQGRDAETPGPEGDLVITCQIIENTLINSGASGTGLSSFEVGFDVLGQLHRHTFNGVNTIVQDGLEPLRLNDEITGDVAWEARLKMRCGTMPVTKVQQPMASIADDLVTLTTGTSGAAIYFTTDNSLPTPSNGTLYTVPFAVPTSGTLLRATATKAGHVMSMALYKQF